MEMNPQKKKVQDKMSRESGVDCTTTSKFTHHHQQIQIL